MLFSFKFITVVGPIDFGSTDELKRQSYSIFLSFQRLDPITRLFSLISTSPGTARQYQKCPRSTARPADSVLHDSIYLADAVVVS
jgi:hypothetical protein